MGKKIFLLVAVLVLFFGIQNAQALVCDQSQIAGDSDHCWSMVQVASNETTLVSKGTVLVYDITNAKFTVNGAVQARVATASAAGIYAAGVAQNPIVSGEQGMVLVYGKGYVDTATSEAITSGNALWVSVSGQSAIVSSTTQKQLGFALESQTQSGNTKGEIDAFITLL